MRNAAVLSLVILLCGCQHGPSEVVDKVLIDFGVREKPEGYVTEADRVRERLHKVGDAELRRLNLEGRHGEVKFDEGRGLEGKFFKEIKKYENFHPLDVNPVAKADQQGRGYVGYIDFTYRVYQSARRPTRAEAAALSADIPTDEMGRESYRYRFGSGGTWDGAKGEPTRR